MTVQSFSTAIVSKDSLEELELHRNRALECYKKAAELIAEGNRAAQLCVKEKYGFTLSRHDTDHLWSTVNIDKFLESCRKSVDYKLWTMVIGSTPLESLMHHSKLEKFKTQMYEEPIPATADNIYATMMTLTASAGDTFTSGLVEAFSCFSKDHKTNDPFKVKPKAILSHIVNMTYGLSPIRYGRGRDILNDLDRCMHILDGKPWHGYGGLVDHVNEAEKKYNRTFCETPYFKAKWYGNGNIHLEFVRKDLLIKVNEIIAQHYGEVLASASTRG